MPESAGTSFAARCVRARQHLDTLLQGMAGWTVHIVTFLAPDGLSQSTRLYPADPDAPRAWALDLSDMIHSARAALDNAAYALAESHAGPLSRS